MPRILHLLSQRPGQTGSGITLRELIGLSSEAGWKASAAYAVNIEESLDAPIPALMQEHSYPLSFQSPSLPFPIPGMSDVMPYESRRWSDMNPVDLTKYRQAWSEHLRSILDKEDVELIHAHHLWLLSSQLMKLPSKPPVVLHCHATALRQMQSCPHLRSEALQSLQSVDALCVLHEAQAELIHREFHFPERKIHVVGAGYNDAIFHFDQDARQAHRSPLTPPSHHGQLLYAGKFANSKGLDILLDLVEPLSKHFPGFRLHLAGSGSGEEGRLLEQRARAMTPHVVCHGRLSQIELAKLMRQAHSFVLPSLYEGLPLVLIEALASGCRLVASDLPGVQELAKRGLDDFLGVVPFGSELQSDSLNGEQRSHFSEALLNRLIDTLESEPLRLTAPLRQLLDSMSWRGVFARVEKVWTEVLSC